MPRIIHIDADIVDVNVLFLPGFDSLTKHKILLDVGNYKISFAKMKSEVLVLRKNGHSYGLKASSLLFENRHLFCSQADRIYQLLCWEDLKNITPKDL